MHLNDFDYSLPESLIAARPAHPRSSARLLVAEAGRIRDAIVADLPHFLRRGDRLVLNDTRVIPARLTGTRLRTTARGTVSARIEVMLLRPNADGTWLARVRPLRKLKPSETLVFSEGFRAVALRITGGQAVLGFSVQGSEFDDALRRHGEIPLPPYIAGKRDADARDIHDYQSVWARHDGAVAAPTASLHFDEALLDALARGGVVFSHVTLHVGAGTFQPVRVEDVTAHRMHAEWGRVSSKAAREIAGTRAAGGRIIPVGTTALRLVETAARGGEIAPWEGDTDIFIHPGFTFRVSDALLTNFHLPKSTLLMLVSAFVGHDSMRAIYRHAVGNRYRFLSYGDASLLIP